MSEFELRRALRALDTGREPGRDLWPGIAARIEAPAASTAAPRSWLPVLLATAASLLLAVLVALPMLPRTSAPGEAPGAPLAAHGDTPATAESGARPDALLVMADAMTLEYRLALQSLGGQPLPPELAPAMAELDSSATRIRAALREDPQADYLVGQLRRTYAQRLRLTQQALTS